VALLVGNAEGDAPPPSSAGLARPFPAAPLYPLPTTPESTVALGRALPDPLPLAEKSQWVYDFRYAGGEIYLLGIHRLELPVPRETPRVMGRFCLELYEGRVLLERARFDFPMLGDGSDLPLPVAVGLPEGGVKTPRTATLPSFTKVSSRIGVMFPSSTRGTRIDIVDRALGRRWPLPWPPTEMTALANDSMRDAGEMAHIP